MDTRKPGCRWGKYQTYESGQSQSASRSETHRISWEPSQPLARHGRPDVDFDCDLKHITQYSILYASAENAGLENAGLENDGLENDGLENDGLENDVMVLKTSGSLLEMRCR